MPDKPLTSLLDELAWRGLLEDQTPGLAERLAKGPIKGYVGFDPTAPSLQLGNLVPLLLLAHLQRAGGTPLVVLGGGTGMIGDPSGRRTERPLLDADTLAENVARQRCQFERYLAFGDGAGEARMLDNAEWLRPLNLVEFLRGTGKHFTLSYMLQKESVRSRLDEGISYTEFSYMLLQAYDFLHLYREHGVELQMGGSDQWGNITAGRELVRRVTGGEVHGLCAPLLTTAGGAKFGKTEEGALWLDAEMTSPYRLFQYWVNADDRDVERYLRVFTFRTRDEIAGLMDEHARAAGARVPHRALAAEVTARVHGEEAARRAADASRILFGELDPHDADAGTWAMLAAELPTANIDLSASVPAVDAVVAAGLGKSKGEARRLLSQGGITLNGAPLGADGAVGAGDVLAGRYVWLRRGKKTDAILITAKS